MSRLFLTSTMAFGLQAVMAMAGPVADFEAVFQPAYAIYRTALFTTNSGKPDAALASVGALEQGWADLARIYAAAPPPQFEDDVLWGQTLVNVGQYIALAHQEVGKGALAEAHETLEAVRDEIGALHARNGIERFSDRMNAYHAEMEAVLGLDLSTLDIVVMGVLRERAAVLDYLAQELLSHPPVAENPEFDGLAATVRGSVDALLAAVRMADAEAVRAAIGGLKVPYSKLFLKFG